MPDAALDATAEALTRRLLVEVPADRPRGGADIDRLPAPLVPILRARLGAAVDGAAPTPSDWLDGAAVHEATEGWRRAAADAVRIPADVWPEALREAVALALAHLIRPADTLAAVAFANGEPVLPVEAALGRARTFGPYPYLPQIAARYADRKGLDRIDRAGLEQLLRRIDRRMVSTFGPDDWATLLSPLLDLVGPVGSPPGAVPAALLHSLFMTKGAGTLAVELEGADSVSPDHLRALLDRTLVAADGPQRPQEETPSPPLEEAPHDEAVQARGGTPPSDRLEPPPPAAAPLPPLAEPLPPPPTIGSKYQAPEFDASDVSEVLGPPVPVSSAPGADEDAGFFASEPPAPTVSREPVAPDPGGAPVGEDASGDDELKPLSMPEADPNGYWDGGLGSGEAAPAPDEADAIAETVAPPPHETAAGPGDEAPDPVRGSNPLIRPEPPSPSAAPPAPTIADSFVFPDDDEAAPPLPEAAPPADAGAPPPPTGGPAYDEEPLWKQLVRERNDEGAPPAAAPTTAPDDDEEPLWKQFAMSDLAAKLPPPAGEADALPDLDALEARVLGPGARERRDWYVTELFGGSRAVYRRTLARIDQAASYSEATDIISSDILRAYSIDPYTESMVAFIDAVQDQSARR